MDGLRFLFFLVTMVTLSVLFLADLCSAAVIGPRVYAQRDIGGSNLKTFTYSISVDCDKATLSIYVYNQSIKPVPGASIYLKYIDSTATFQALSTSDLKGHATIEFPGKTKFMRGVFALILEKGGYRTKEIDFDIAPCYANVSSQKSQGTQTKSTQATTTQPKTSSTTQNSTAASIGSTGSSSTQASSSQTPPQSQTQEQPQTTDGNWSGIISALKTKADGALDKICAPTILTPLIFLVLINPSFKA